MNSLALDTLRETAVNGFEATFGAEPTHTAVAPGRVNLIGEHIDYCDGFVLPLALERQILVVFRKNGTDKARLSTAFSPSEVVEVSLRDAFEVGEPKWANYVRGVFQGFRERCVELPGFDAYLVSDVPVGGGLSSSAALELAFATVCEGLSGQKLSTAEKALLCQKAEHEFANVPCGIMDQFASAFGEASKLVLIDCQSQEVELVPFTAPDLSIIVANTNVAHDLSDGAYGERRKQTELALEVIGKQSWREVSMADLEAHSDKLEPVVVQRARHVIGEIERTIKAVEALKSGEFTELGGLMRGSHESLRDDFEVSCRELDLMCEIAWKIGVAGGVLGSRMTGGGFGGSTVTLAKSDKAEEVMQTLRDAYVAETGIEPVIFSTRPGAGARLLEA